ncbi:MAG TPA: PQQ-binding-like beta-propeller repeat protein [Pyrinomonadaceae bacterium]|nr:PQQ-binding-like beta-propeller repeat protein [Pyrinomonadaceae bacterium]
MKTIRHKELLVIALFLLIGLTACASHSSEAQSNAVPPAPANEIPAPTGQPRLIIQMGHDNAVNGIAFSPDGKLIATAGGERTVKLWDSATGTELRSLVGHYDAVFAVAFSPNGKTIASGSYDGTVKLWDAASGIEIRSLNAHGFGVYAVAFSPDGKIIASGGGEDTRDDQQQPHAIKFWDAATGDLLRSVERESQVRSVAFSPDGKAIASDSWGNNAVVLWDTESGKKIHTLQSKASELESVAFSPDGKLIAGGVGAHRIELWDAVTGNLLRTLEAKPEGLDEGRCEAEANTATSLVITFSPDSKSIVSGACDYTTKLWDVATGQQTHSWNGHSGGVVSVAFSPDGKAIASGSLDQTVKVWDLASTKELYSLASHVTEIQSLAVSPDGRIIARGSTDGKVKLWDTATRKPLQSLEGHVYRINALAFSKDGRIVASGGADNKILLWNVATGRLLRSLIAGPVDGTSESAPRLTSLAFSPDGKLIASAGNSYRITLWNTATGKELRSPIGESSGGGMSSVKKVAFSPDGKVLAASYEESVVLWNVASGRKLLSIEDASASSLAFSPDGRMIATGSGDGTMKLWDAATGKELRAFAGHDDWHGSKFFGPEVNSLTFSPDGKTLASGSHDSLIKLWDVANGALLRTFVGHNSAVQSVVFSNGGKVILSGSHDGTMKLWRPESDEPSATLVALDKVDWVVLTPDGRFDASPGAEKRLHFVANTRDGQYQIIPLQELRSRHYEAGLLPKLLKRGV